MKFFLSSRNSCIWFIVTQVWLYNVHYVHSVGKGGDWIPYSITRNLPLLIVFFLTTSENKQTNKNFKGAFLWWWNKKIFKISSSLFAWVVALSRRRGADERWGPGVAVLNKDKNKRNCKLINGNWRRRCTVIRKRTNLRKSYKLWIKLSQVEKTRNTFVTGT